MIDFTLAELLTGLDLEPTPISTLPRIEIGGEIVEIVACETCGRTVLRKSRAATGFIAPCGRRLINISECGTATDICYRSEPSDESSAADEAEAKPE